MRKSNLTIHSHTDIVFLTYIELTFCIKLEEFIIEGKLAHCTNLMIILHLLKVYHLHTNMSSHDDNDCVINKTSAIHILLSWSSLMCSSPGVSCWEDCCISTLGLQRETAVVEEGDTDDIQWNLP